MVFLIVVLAIVIVVVLVGQSTRPRAVRWPNNVVLARQGATSWSGVAVLTPAA